MTSKKKNRQIHPKTEKERQLQKEYKLILEKRKRDKDKIKPISKEKKKKQVMDWCTFYRRNWNIYAQEELGIKLYFFQHIIVYLVGMSNTFFLMCSRNYAKSFLAILCAVIHCMLYPYAEVVVTAQTLNTARKLVKEKVEKELINKLSPKLKYLYDIGLIKISDNKEEIKIDFLFNKSWIKVLPEKDSSLGERATMILYEEARILKQYSVDSIFAPMSRPRQSAFLQKKQFLDPNTNYEKPLPEFLDNAKTVYMTSTKYKYMWFFTRWKKIVNKCLNDLDKNSKIVYNFMCGDIFTSIYHGIKSETDLQGYVDTMSDIELKMEIYNEPQGEVEGSYYNLKEFKDVSVIEKAFIPPTPYEYLVDYNKGEIPYFREPKDEEVRVIYVDFAFSDSVQGKAENDNTVIGCASCYPNDNRTRLLRNFEHMETFSGGKKDESILRIRELFYLYEADYLIFDSRNGGIDRYIDLTKPYYHEEMDINMNGFGIYKNDDILKEFCDLGRVNDLRSKVVDINSIPVTIPVFGTDERNNNYHIEMKNALQRKLARFLVDELEMKQKLDEDINFVLADSEYKARKLIGFVQFDEMISEAIKLEQFIKKGFLHLTEVGSNKKDRIVATEYCNYFFKLLETKMLKDEQETEEYDESVWTEIYNYG